MELLIWTRNPRLTWISPSSCTQFTPKLITRSGSTSRSKILSCMYRGRWTSTGSSDLVTSRTAWWKSNSPRLLASTLARTSPRCSLARAVACRGREVPGVMKTSFDARRRNGRVESPEGALLAPTRRRCVVGVPWSGHGGMGPLALVALAAGYGYWWGELRLRSSGVHGIDGGNNAGTGHRSGGSRQRRRQDGSEVGSVRARRSGGLRRGAGTTGDRRSR